MGDTTIEWTDKVWNPVTGCTKVSQGCKNCYAERVFPRVYGHDRIDLSKPGGKVKSPRRFTDVWTHPDRLDHPLRWKKPRRIFVNSMSDLFHEDVPDYFIDTVFGVMALCERLTFQILTKRPERLRRYFERAHLPQVWFEETRKYAPTWLAGRSDEWWPRQAKHVHLGVSCEDQPTADERIPLLLQTPAAVRFVSLEPLLGPIDLTKLATSNGVGHRDALRGLFKNQPANVIARDDVVGRAIIDVDVGGKIDWVIVGGESGPHARPMHTDWVRSLRDQCVAAGVPFFFKQGSKANWPNFKNFESFPEDLQIREFPR